MNAFQRGVKRVTDFVCALLGLVVLFPVFLVIALIMIIQKNGPVLFAQERIGYGGKPFTIYKFRTLSTVVEDEGPQLVAKSDSVKSTKFERFLREYFINQIMEHTHDYELIYQMRPGLTSEATLYNGYTDTMEKMLKRLDMDIRYLEHRSLGLDTKIILSTIYNVLSGKKF